VWWRSARSASRRGLGTAARLALALGVSLLAGAAFTFLLLRGIDRAAPAVEALQALRKLPMTLEATRRTDRGSTRCRSPGEWRHRALQADAARRRIEESVLNLAAIIGESATEEFRPLDPLPVDEEPARTLASAAGVLVEAARRLREMAGVLLAQIEDDLEAAGEPLAEAGEMMASEPRRWTWRSPECGRPWGHGGRSS